MSDSLGRMTMSHLASIDGELSPTELAVLPLPDDGLYRGDGAFEVIRAYRGRPFALREHLDRIERSASAIELPVDREAIERELEQLLERAGDEDGLIRIVLTRGGRRILLAEPLPSWGETACLSTVPYSPALLLTGVKSISYAANMQATRIAKSRGADEALLVRPSGIVLEAPTSTLFWVSEEGRLVTPALETGILDSITRAKLLEVLEVDEGEYRLEGLMSATEAFLASTTREVQAVARIDEREFEAPGPRTREAQEMFHEVVERELGLAAGA